MKSKPNVLLIVCDALRSKNLPEWGYHRMTAPNITELCDRSIVYRNAYAHVNYTTPSVATILTGKYMHEHGIWRLYYPTKEEVKESGAMYWKWKLREPSLAAKLKGTHRTIMINEIFVDLLDKNGILWSDFEVVPSNYSGQKGLTIHPDSSMPVHPTAEQTTNEAIKQLVDASENDDRPFFMYVHYWDTHWPPSAPKEYVDQMYDGTNPEHMHKMFGPRKLPLARKQVREQIAARTEKRDLNYLKAWYDAEIKYMDEQIGRLLSVLPENTLIVLTADHAEAMGEHYGIYFGHVECWLYEEVLKVPLIVSFPHSGYRKKTIYDRVENRMIFDIIWEYVQKEIPLIVESDYIYSATRESDQFTPHLDVLIKNDLKLFVHDYGSEAYGFNLKDDPDERNALLLGGRPEFQELKDILMPMVHTLPPKPEEDENKGEEAD